MADHLRVCIIASGVQYQRLAAICGATFARFVSDPSRVTVYLPDHEDISEYLSRARQRVSFGVAHFALPDLSPGRYTAQFKCHAYARIVQDNTSGNPFLIVDADTLCFGPVDFSDSMMQAVREGCIALARDIVDRHASDVLLPWYVEPSRRTPYVNAGVILASAAAAEFFAHCLALSKQENFWACPFNDQTIINYVLSTCPGKLVLLDERYNRFWPWLLRSDTVVGHLACGPRRFLYGRIAKQAKLASEILGYGSENLFE